MTTSTNALPSHALTAHTSSKPTALIESLYMTAALLDRVGFAMLRLGLVVVLCWIGGSKLPTTKRKASCLSWPTVR